VLLDTLEHVRDPRRALAEVYRVLQPDGIAVATSVMDLFIHCRPDYWRFTPEAFRLLFREFGQALVGFQGNPEKPHTVFAIGVKQPSRRYDADFAAIQRAYRARNRTWYWRIAQPYYVARDAFAIIRHNNAFGFEVHHDDEAHNNDDDRDHRSLAA
jgi:SAM-dependent methyltransferase